MLCRFLRVESVERDEGEVGVEVLESLRLSNFECRLRNRHQHPCDSESGDTYTILVEFIRDMEPISYSISHVDGQIYRFPPYELNSLRIQLRKGGDIQ